MTDKAFQRAKDLRDQINKVDVEKSKIKEVYDNNKSNVLIVDICQTAHDALDFKISVLIKEFREL